MPFADPKHPYYSYQEPQYHANEHDGSLERYRRHGTLRSAFFVGSRIDSNPQEDFVCLTDKAETENQKIISIESTSCQQCHLMCTGGQFTVHQD